MSAKGKKLHHYVPRFYLRAWAVKDQIYCLQGDKILRSNVRNVGAENYFYRLHEPSPGDVEFLREVITRISPKALRGFHERVVNIMAAPHLAKRRIEGLEGIKSASTDKIERMIIELIEDLHTILEDDFRPYLAAMTAGDLQFLDSEERSMGFYMGLAFQYLRTNHIRQMGYVVEPDQLEQYRRIVNPLVYILATNVGMNLYANRERHSIMLVDNSTRVPFITGDQPLINMAADPRASVVPEKFELYYPISPTKAMILFESPSDSIPKDLPLSEMAVDAFNLRMVAHSYRQVFSNSQQVLESVRDVLPAYASCFTDTVATNRQ